MFPSLAAATSVANKIATSQIALPKAACDLVYATAGYEAASATPSQVTLARDNVFSDGSSLELATITGDVGRAACGGPERRRRGLSPGHRGVLARLRLPREA